MTYRKLPDDPAMYDSFTRTAVQIIVDSLDHQQLEIDLLRSEIRWTACAAAIIAIAGLIGALA